MEITVARQPCVEELDVEVARCQKRRVRLSGEGEYDILAVHRVFLSGPDPEYLSGVFEGEAGQTAGGVDAPVESVHHESADAVRIGEDFMGGDGYSEPAGLFEVQCFVDDEAGVVMRVDLQDRRPAEGLDGRRDHRGGGLGLHPGKSDRVDEGADRAEVDAAVAEVHCGNEFPRCLPVRHDPHISGSIAADGEEEREFVIQGGLRRPRHDAEPVPFGEQAGEEARHRSAAGCDGFVRQRQ